MRQIYVAKDVEAACETSLHYGFQDLVRARLPTWSHESIVDSNENLLNMLICWFLGMSSQSYGIYHCQTQYIKYQHTDCVESWSTKL